MGCIDLLVYANLTNDHLFYQEAFEFELVSRNIPIIPQKELTVKYKGQLLKKTYVADMVGFGEIIVEKNSGVETVSRYKTTSSHS